MLGYSTSGALYTKVRTVSISGTKITTKASTENSATETSVSNTSYVAITRVEAWNE